MSTNGYRMILTVLLLVNFSSKAEGIHLASFFGASYLHVPMQDAKSTTEIQLKFRTSRPDSLLILVAGKIDYCLVILEAGALKVRINIGAGEVELSSTRGLKLNDLLWHHIQIGRQDADMKVVIDRIHIVRKKLPGRFYELNIDHGVLVGGMGDFQEIFLGNLNHFRGCMEDLTYNGIDVFSSARNNVKNAEIYSVMWDCSDEFEADRSAAISFVEDGSYLSAEKPIGRTGATLQFEVKTQSLEGLVMYSTSVRVASDFVGVELRDGRPTLLVDTGDGVVVIMGEQRIDDGSWHKVKIQFSKSYLEVTVDHHMTTLRPLLGDNKLLDTSGFVYFGGVELNLQARAVQQGMLSGHLSLRGCLRDIRLDDVPIGFPDVYVTHHLLPGCQWEYPCKSDPCIEGAVCAPEGLDSFRCVCDTAPCIKPNVSTGYTVYSQSALPVDMEILSLAPLRVQEGHSAIITSKNLRIQLEYEKYGIRESGVLFIMTHPPQHGRLEVSIWSAPQDKMFTLLDLNTDKVRYLHDGSEESRDYIVFEIELVTQAGFILPQYLQGHHKFIFHIEILPVNDPPRLVLPPGSTIRLAMQTSLPLTPDVLQADDPDNSPLDLIYSIMNLDTEKEGVIQNVHAPDKPIASFSQDEVNSGSIYYVHKGSESSRFALRVSDGSTTSPTEVIRVTAYPLEVHVANNTGLTLSRHSQHLITLQNLSFTTNAEGQKVDIVVDIIKPCQYGIVQKLGPAGQWAPVSSFSVKQLDKRQISYQHTIGEPDGDLFKFRLIVNGRALPHLYEFRINFIAVKITLIHREELQLHHVTSGTIGGDNLQASTTPYSTTPEKIEYMVLTLPLYGDLRVKTGLKSKVLQEGDVFTEHEVQSDLVSYNLKYSAHSIIYDDFQFQIRAAGEITHPFTLTIHHTPLDSDVYVALSTLQVLEGDKVTLTEDNLQVSKQNIRDITYRVLAPPPHGHIDVLKPNLQEVDRHNTTFFTSQEVAAEQVTYVHDDSESPQDTVQFQAVSTRSPEEFLFVGALGVNVTLRNDNTPIRPIESVFHIVTGGERLLSRDVLEYVDPDVDSSPRDIQYTRRSIPNGALFSVDKPEEEIFQFTQEDVNLQRVLVRHRGDLYGRTILWVTDGEFYTTGVLEIQASEPFIVIQNNTGAVLTSGEVVPITCANLSVTTNMNVRPEDVQYRVLLPPAEGRLELAGQDSQEFTQDDICRGQLLYRHVGPTAASDEFRFRVKVNQTEYQTNFHVRIFPDSYRLPLLVTSNRTLPVEEHSSITISPTALSIKHDVIPPEDIVFIVLEHPRNGYLEVDPNSPPHIPLRTGKQALTFTQAMVSQGHVRYVNTEPNTTTDRFVYDVTNGIAAIRNQNFRFEIIPKIIPVATQAVVVNEGENVTLTEVNIKVLTTHYRKYVTHFDVMKPPKHGLLLFSSNHSHVGKRFTMRNLQEGDIVYQHDNSESMMDYFKIQAKTNDRVSVPVHVKIEVIQVNDETPHLVNNSKLKLWEASAMTLTPQYLAAIDLDTPANQITYNVKNPKGGYFTSVVRPSLVLYKFTQADINQANILFAQSGSYKEASFTFSLTDGIHETAEYHSVVEVLPLTLTLVVKKSLRVFPMVQELITTDHLCALTNDQNPQRYIQYRVKRKPQFGSILLSQQDGSLLETPYFTQSDVNSSHVFYKHTTPHPNVTLSDHLVFDVESKPAPPVENQRLDIVISVASGSVGGLRNYFKISDLTVKEGHEVTITERHFNTSGLLKFLQQHRSSKDLTRVALRLRVDTVPAHGYLQIDGVNMTEPFEFSQSDVTSGQFKYVHDDSETTHDTISIFIYFVDSTLPRDILIFNGSIEVNVTPVNDQPFDLVTKQPGMSVVQREVKVISSEHLEAQDNDTSPKNIIYEVIGGPSHGKLVFKHKRNVTVGFFSQEVVNSRQLLYHHDGSLESDAFFFKVTDGQYTPLYSRFVITVEALTLEVRNNTPTVLQQGSQVTYISRNNIGVHTNGMREFIFFNVTHPPQYGQLLMNDGKVSMFGQSNVDRGEVMYLQINMTAKVDRFNLTIWNFQHILLDQQFLVTVTPLVTFHPNITFSTGQRVKLTTDLLDASDLAALTGSNPTYTVIQKPTFAKIKKVVSGYLGRFKGNPKLVLTSKFTHDEVREGRIYLVIRKFDLVLPIHDSFEFLLTAAGVQPAQGYFHFDLASEEFLSKKGLKSSGMSDSRDQIGTPDEVYDVNFNTPISTVGSQGAVTPSMSPDYLLMVGMIGGVLLIVVLFLVGLKFTCGAARKKATKPEVSRESPELNVCPNGDIVEQSQYSGHFDPPQCPRSSHHDLGSCNSDCDVSRSREMSPSVPQCTVIPLCHAINRVSSADSRHEDPPRYVGSEEDWNGSEEDHCEQRTSNPLLRKNQYWV